MDKQQAIEIVRNTFENPFEEDRFAKFIKNLLNHVEADSRTYKGNYVPDAFRHSISSLRRIGKYNDGKNSIDVLIVRLKNENSIDRARTMQRNFIAWYLNGSRGGTLKDAALVAFVSSNYDNWRFSLVKMDYTYEEAENGKIKVKQEFTPARRWSFLVGKNEKSHTAQSRLIPIMQDDKHDPTLDDLEEGFDIEPVTDEFFSKYRDLFIRTKEELDKVVSSNVKVRDDFKSKSVNTVDFAKKLLGQIVFLYFLQKKGWFGVERDSDWGTGSKKFLRELFEGRHGEYECFFNDILEPLFFEALRIDRSHDDNYYSRFNCKIPFLNGGLFDPIGNYDWVHTDIEIPNDLFSNTRKTKEGDMGNGIFDVFDRYNFTVEEAEPLEKEVAIDPELLGKTYEKFNAIREDNFDKYKDTLKNGKKGAESKFNKQYGVYYTPRDIVHYMCQESLMNYLETQLNDSVSKEDLETLIHHSEKVVENEARVNKAGRETDRYFFKMPDSIRKSAKKIDEKLQEIKICDPAVGSGAFPVGMMSEIVKARLFFSESGLLAKTYINPRGESVERSQYQFKRDCIENSLYGVDIDPGAVEIARLRLWLSLVVDEDDIRQIRPLPNLDFKIVCGNSLLGLESVGRNKLMFKLDSLSALRSLISGHMEETSPTKKQEYISKIASLMNDITDGYHIFDFRIHFAQVFLENDGFDIVIANPPYIRQEKLEKQLKEYLVKNYKSMTGSSDIYVAFYEKGLELLRENGVLVYISSNKFLRAKYGKKLTQFLQKNCVVSSIVDFGDLPVFDATTYPCILTVKKTLPSKSNKLNYLKVENLEYRNLEDELRLKSVSVIIQRDSENWVLEDNAASSLLEKIKTSGIPLGQYVNGKIFYGIKTGYNKAFIIDKAKRQELIEKDPKSEEIIKPYLTGKEIKRYSIEWKGKYLITAKDGLDLPRDFRVVFEHLTQYREHLEKRWDKGEYWYQLRPCSYYNEFEKPKIIYPNIAKEPLFALDRSKYYPNQKCFVLGIEDSFLLGALNSNVMAFWFKKVLPKLRGGYYEPSKVFMESFPIPVASIDAEEQITKLVDFLSSCGNKSAAALDANCRLNKLIYQLYGLSSSEIELIEDS